MFEEKADAEDRPLDIRPFSWLRAAMCANPGTWLWTKHLLWGEVARHSAIG
jgi:hypothetical protein